jgi:hypothetical protein
LDGRKWQLGIRGSAPGKRRWGVAFFGKNNPGTAAQLVTEYKDFKVVPIDLGRYGPGARDAFLNAIIKALGPGSNYSLTNKNIGTVCSAAIERGFEAAREAQKPLPRWVKNLKTSFERVTLLGLNQLNLYTPKDAYLEVEKHSVPFRIDPAAPLAKREWLVVGQVIVVVETANAELDAPSPLLSSVGLVSKTYDLRIDDVRIDDVRIDDAPLQPATGQGKQTSQQELKGPSDDDEGDEDALTDDSLQDPETDADDDEDDLEEEVLGLESNSQDARTRDAPQQPEIDDDADDDDEDTLIDDAAPQPVIDDDDEEPSQEDDEEDEELVDASDAEEPADAPVMQTAKAEAGADATADDQSGASARGLGPRHCGGRLFILAIPQAGSSTRGRQGGTAGRAGS